MEKKENLILGASICTLGYLFMALMSAFTKMVIEEIPVIMVVFVQNIICLILTLPQVFKEGISHLKTERITLHITRDIMGLLSFISLFLSLGSLSLVDGILLQNTAPLWIPLVVFVWLKIKIRRDLWWGMIVGFIGVILILKPGTSLLQAGAFLGICSGVFLGATLVAIRKLAITEPSNRILFYYFLFGAIITAPFSFRSWISPSLQEWIYLLLIGIFMYAAQILITYSFKYGKASKFAPLAYTVVLFSAILGWIIFDHLPNFLSFLGIILVVVGGILSIYFENKYEKKIMIK